MFCKDRLVIQQPTFIHSETTKAHHRISLFFQPGKRPEKSLGWETVGSTAGNE